MEPSNVSLCSTSSEAISQDSSAATMSSSTVEISSSSSGGDIVAAAVAIPVGTTIAATTPVQHRLSVPPTVVSFQTGTIRCATPQPVRGGSDGPGYTEVSASGTAQAGDLPQSPKEAAKESASPQGTSGTLETTDTPTSSSPEAIQKISMQTQASPIFNLLERTGYPIVQQNGQRRYGPPPSWDGTPPPRGSEVFVGKIPRDCFEDELVPVFETVGRIYEIRLMMDHFSELNRGYAFVVFSTSNEAKECVKQLNNYEIRQGRTLGICMSVDNCRLFIGGIPKKVTKEDIVQEMMKVTEGVVDVIVYPSASDKSKNRGFAFVEYDSHRSAAMARRKLMNNRIQLWGHNIAVDWAEPELEVDEEIMSQVKVLYIRNLMLNTTEAQIEEAFSIHAPVERVKKIKDYAFVHFGTKQHAHTAMQAMNGSVLDGAQIEVTLAKPVDKDSYLRSPKYNRQLSVPAFYVPVDQFGSILPFYPSYYSPPKYMLRNSMGACTMPARMGRNPRGRGRGYFPAMSYSSPSTPRYVYQTSPTLATGSAAAAGASPPFYQTTPTAAYFDAASPKRSPEEQLNVPTLVEVAHPNTAMAIKSTKNSVQILEEICQKSNWGQPIFTLHSTANTNPDDDTLFLYKVMVPGLSMTYIPAKLTRSVEEAKVIAAEYTLVQLGYPMEATSYTPARPLHFPEIPLCAANFVAVQNSPKPATWAALGTVDPTTAAVAAAATAIYPAPAYTPENPFPAPQGYTHPQEYYQQGF